ncbi:hypothetical protein GCM10023144_23010 [Pigmentiphaga soli]|uniref:Uncharacterized protein n=1 Tax=Pigmentiphaga soli TaxID=1007095 RepID=A0ABP8H0P4_9BURK
MAVACRVVQVRAGVALPVAIFSLIRARPKFTPVRLRPSASPVPPLRPAKASTPAAPMVSSSTSAVLSSDRTTVSVLLRMANVPSTWKKP